MKRFLLSKLKTSNAIFILMVIITEIIMVVKQSKWL